MARSNGEERIFREAGDYLAELTIIGGVVRQGLIACHMACVMPTHYHLLASVDELSVPTVMHKLNRRYAVRFNRRHERHGRVFDGHTARRIESEAHLFEVIRYIANNPREPEGWAYSSYPGMLGLRPQFGFVNDEPLLALFNGVDHLRRFVDERREETQQPGSGFTGNKVA